MLVVPHNSQNKPKLTTSFSFFATQPKQVSAALKRLPATRSALLAAPNVILETRCSGTFTGTRLPSHTIYRWVQRSAPELEKRCRPHLKACNDSWKVDETYIKVKKVWMYLYRAVDSDGKTLEFLLSPIRDAEAAKRFFLKALPSSARSASQNASMHETETESRLALQSTPRVINVDKNAAYPKAIADLKAAGMLLEGVELRQVKYLNNLIEQDHRFIKRLVKPGMGFFSFETAWRTLQGYAAMHMIRKGQMQGVHKKDSSKQAAFIAELFGVAI